MTPSLIVRERTIGAFRTIAHCRPELSSIADGLLLAASALGDRIGPGLTARWGPFVLVVMPWEPGTLALCEPRFDRSSLTDDPHADLSHVLAIGAAIVAFAHEVGSPVEDFAVTDRILADQSALFAPKVRLVRRLERDERDLGWVLVRSDAPEPEAPEEWGWFAVGQAFAAHPSRLLGLALETAGEVRFEDDQIVAVFDRTGVALWPRH